MYLRCSALVGVALMACGGPGGSEAADAGADDAGLGLGTVVAAGARGPLCSANLVAEDDAAALVWHEAPPGENRRVAFARMSAAGALLVGPVALIDVEEIVGLWIHPRTGGYLVVIAEASSATIALRIDSAGEIESMVTHQPRGEDRSSVVIDGSLSWDLYSRDLGDGLRVHFRGLGDDGAIEAAETLILDPGSSAADPAGAAVADGVWVAYRRGEEVQLGKVDGAGIEKVAPLSSLAFGIGARPEVAATADGVLVAAVRRVTGEPGSYRVGVHDPTGAPLGPRFDLAGLRNESPTLAVAAVGASGFVAYESDAATAFVRVGLVEVDLKSGASLERFVTRPEYQASCPSVGVSGDTLVLSYRVFEPAPTLRVQFFAP